MANRSEASKERRLAYGREYARKKRERINADPVLREKKLAEMRKYHHDNREERLIKNREWWALNREKMKEYKSINRERNEIKRLAWIERNKAKVLADSRANYAANKERYAAHNVNWKKNNPDYEKNWRKANAERLRAKYRERMKNDPQFRIRGRLKDRIRKCLKGRIKFYKLADGLGCTVVYLMEHLQSKFKPGMSWNNYGKWHIDHVLPIASFDLTKIEDQAACFHWTNLQPLWALENILKSDKLNHQPNNQ